MAKAVEPTKKDILKWTKALRSNKYKQSTLALNNASGHCCLGVACEIFIPKSRQLRTTTSNFLHGSVPDEQPRAPRWLKNINDDVGYKNDNNVSSLSSLNDQYGYNFNEIADILELIYIHAALD